MRTAETRWNSMEPQDIGCGALEKDPASLHLVDNFDFVKYTKVVN